MDQRSDPQLSATDLADRRHDAAEPPASWVRPAAGGTATPIVGEAAGPPDPAMHAEAPADARPSPPDVPENGRMAAVPRAEAQPAVEEPLAPPDHESPELDLRQAEVSAEGQVELMAVDARKQYRVRWSDIQTSFVDDPAQAVRQADRLVADVMEHLATTFAEERGRLEKRWSQGNEDTEHLRLALRRYRQLFSLLLKG